MAATAYIDRVTTLEAVERHGVIRSMTREARVIFPKADIPNQPNKQPYTILDLAMNVTGMPQPFSTPLDANGKPSLGYEALVLVERSAKLLPGDINTVDVTLKYEHLLDGPNQPMTPSDPGLASWFPAPAKLIYGKGRCSITEKTTNFYYPQGDPTKGRILILTAHTFPQWEVGIVGMPLNPALPRTVIQGGEVSIPYPQENFQLQGVLTTKDPRGRASQFIARINDGFWMGQAACTWICSEVQWEVLNPQNSTYKFSWEFQYNIDTWNPTVAFNDTRTSRPPAGVVLANVVANPATKAALIANVALLVTQAAAVAVSNPSLSKFLTAQAAAMASNLSSFGIMDGTMRFTTNPVNGAIQPAGVWTVPALRPVNFDSLFGSLFEGFNAPQIP